MHLKEFPSKPICLYLLLVYLKARLCRNDSSCLPAALRCLSPSSSLCRVSRGRHWAPAATDPACPSANWEAVPSWWVSAGGLWDRLSPRAAPSLMQRPWDFQVFLEIVGKRWAEMLPCCSPAPAAPWPGPAFSLSDISACAAPKGCQEYPSVMRNSHRDQRGWREDAHNAFTQHLAPGRPAGPSSQFRCPSVLLPGWEHWGDWEE